MCCGSFALGSEAIARGRYVQISPQLAKDCQWKPVQKNCWTFCTVIQQILGRAYKGSFERGELHHERIGAYLQCTIYLDIVQAACDALSAGKESVRNTPQQALQAEQPQARASEASHSSPGPKTHSEPHAPDVRSAAQSSVLIQDSLGPGRTETTQRQGLSRSDPPLGQILNHLVREHHSSP
jgi:hypothetical protein